MKNKGFTLVEILAVIVVLSIIMILAIPAITNVLFGSREALSEINKKNLKEAGELFAQEVYMCTGEDSIVTDLDEKLGYHTITNCQKAKVLLNSGIEVSIEYLRTYNYFTDHSNKCSGNVFVYMSDATTQRIEVDLKNASCTS